MKYILTIITCFTLVFGLQARFSVSHTSFHSSFHSSPHVYHNIPHTSYHPYTPHTFSTKPRAGYTRVHQYHSAPEYHAYSHGYNNYSRPRSTYYHLPLILLFTHSTYHNHYHHCHVGTHKDTVFCTNGQHEQPAAGVNSSSYSTDEDEKDNGSLSLVVKVLLSTVVLVVVAGLIVILING